MKNGKLKSTTDWVKGLKTGSHITYDKDGKVLSNDKYIANTPATDEEYKKWEKSKPKAKAEEELDRFEKWISKPSTMMKGISALFVIVTIVWRPLTAGLLVVGGLGYIWLFKTKNTSYTKRKMTSLKKNWISVVKDLNEMKEELKHWPS
nr:hypothetical protein [Mycoplasmopsis bovis]